MPLDTQTKTQNAPVLPVLPGLPEPEAYTKWGNLVNSNLVPVEVLCMSYPGFHSLDLSCHTRLLLDAATMGNHVDADHGGGFEIKLRQGDKPAGDASLWEGLRKSLIEMGDLECEVCAKKLPLNPQIIRQHMRPHSGKSRRPRQSDRFYLTLQRNSPVPEDQEAFES